MRGSELWWGPWAIALPYLMPTDLTLSLIVFNLLWRAEYVLSRMGGWTTSSYAGFPYGDEQTLGAFLTLIPIVFWLDPRYLAQVLRKAFGLRSLADDSGEAFGYRTAVFGAIGSFAFLWWFLAHAGVRSLLSFPLLVSYLLIMLVVCRLRAQVGPPSMDIRATPELFLSSVSGTRCPALLPARPVSPDSGYPLGLELYRPRSRRVWRHATRGSGIALDGARRGHSNGKADGRNARAVPEEAPPRYRDNPNA